MEISSFNSFIDPPSLTHLLLSFDLKYHNLLQNEKQTNNQRNKTLKQKKKNWLRGAEVGKVKSVDGRGVAGWGGRGEKHGHEIRESIVAQF